MPSKEETRQKLIKEAVKMFENNSSDEDVKNYLKEQGANFYDIDHVMINSKKQLAMVYRESINTHLLTGKTGEEIVNKLIDDKVSKENLLEFIEMEKRSIINKSGNQLYNLLDNGVPLEKALLETINPIFTKELAQQKLEDIQDDPPTYMGVENTSSSDTGLAIGIIALIAGIGLSIGGYMIASPGGSYVVFTGLIVYGLIKTIVSLGQMSAK